MKTRLATAAALALALAGCKQDPKDPKTWIGKLDGAHDQQMAALKQLKALKSPDAVPAVAALLKDATLREEAATVLEATGDKRAVQPLVDAADPTAPAGTDKASQQVNQANTRIATALGALGDPAAVPVLRRLAKSHDNFVRIAAIESLGQLKAKDAVDDLLAIADEPDSPALIVKKCVVALGQIGDPKALPLFERLLVIEKGGVSFISEDSYAIFLLGAQSVEPLTALLGDKDKAFLKWAKDHDRAMAGVYAKAALVLGDIADPRAIPALAPKLKYQDDNSDPNQNFLFTMYVRAYAADALGHMRDKASANAIAAQLSADEQVASEELDMFGARALTSIGDRSQAAKLVDKAKKGEWKRRAYLIQAAANLGGAKEEAALEKLAAGEEPDHAKFIKEQVAKLAAAAACKDAACWRGKLAAPDARVRERAAWEVGWADDAEGVSALVTAAKDPALSVRVAAYRALDLIALGDHKAAAKSAAAPLAAQYEAERGHVDVAVVNEDLKRLVARLQSL